VKLIIAGGRNYQLAQEDYAMLDKLHITEVISGGCSGADRCGERYAISRNLPVKKFPADWGKYGKAAGPIRNNEMAIYADAVALFPGGKGTASMYRCATKHDIKIFDYRRR